jgi:hypothetical protein
MSKEKRETMQVLLESKTFNRTYRDEDRTKIQYLIDFLLAAKEDGATFIQWDGYVSDSCIDDVEITPYFERPENDEEYSARIEKQNAKVEKQIREDEDRDKREYERLKKKFNE